MRPLAVTYRPAVTDTGRLRDRNSPQVATFLVPEVWM